MVPVASANWFLIRIVSFFCRPLQLQDTIDVVWSWLIMTNQYPSFISLICGCYQHCFLIRIASFYCRPLQLQDQYSCRMELVGHDEKEYKPHFIVWIYQGVRVYQWVNPGGWRTILVNCFTFASCRALELFTIFLHSSILSKNNLPVVWGSTIHRHIKKFVRMQILCIRVTRQKVWFFKYIIYPLPWRVHFAWLHFYRIVLHKAKSSQVLVPALWMRI
jgi:hypothetical protein